MTVWQPLLSLVLASAVIMGSPGPSTISVTAVGAAYGIRKSLRYAAGLIVGTTAVLFAVAAGVVAILLSLPHGASVLVTIAAVYMLYLAFRIATAPPLRSDRKTIVVPAFAGGFLLAIANPKAYLAIAAVFAGTTLIAGRDALDAAAKIIVLSGMIVLIHLCWLLAGASLARILHQPLWSRVINVALAAALVAVAAGALLE